MSKSSQKELLQKESNIKIKNSNENNLDNDEIKMMAKQEFYFPENIKEFEVQLYTYITFICLISGDKSILSRQLITWVDHFDRNYSKYES
jgi:hypothetical protein